MNETENLQFLNEMIESFEYIYCLCLNEGDIEEAKHFKQTIDELYEKLYNLETAQE